MAFTLPDGITNRMWYQMCDCNMSLPEPLEVANLSKSFVYDRKFGVFQVPSGSHQAAMSLLLSWHHGLNNGVKVAEHLKLKYSDQTADYYLLNISGTAFLSSVGKSVYAGKINNLNEKEKDYFSNIKYIHDMN